MSQSFALGRARAIARNRNTHIRLCRHYRREQERVQEPDFGIAAKRRPRCRSGAPIVRLRPVPQTAAAARDHAGLSQVETARVGVDLVALDEFARVYGVSMSLLPRGPRHGRVAEALPAPSRHATVGRCGPLERCCCSGWPRSSRGFGHATAPFGCA